MGIGSGHEDHDNDSEYKRPMINGTMLCGPLRPEGTFYRSGFQHLQYAAYEKKSLDPYDYEHATAGVEPVLLDDERKGLAIHCEEAEDKLGYLAVDSSILEDEKEARPMRRRAAQPVWAELDQEQEYSWLCTAQAFMMNTESDDDTCGVLNAAMVAARGYMTDDERTWMEEELAKLRRNSAGRYRGGFGVPEVVQIYYYLHQFPIAEEVFNQLHGRAAPL